VFTVRVCIVQIVSTHVIYVSVVVDECSPVYVQFDQSNTEEKCRKGGSALQLGCRNVGIR